jgi:hypothetical protein
MVMNRRIAVFSVALAGSALGTHSLAQTAGAPPMAPRGSTVIINSLGQTVIVTPSGVDPDGNGGGSSRGGGGVTDGPGDDFALEWISIDGGGRMYLTGDAFEFGTTVGQPDTGAASGECFELTGGFWAVTVQQDCYANCDRSVTAPILNVGDFTCFLQHYAAGDCYANCDGSSTIPVLNVGDFTCFLQRFAAGCP